MSFVYVQPNIYAAGNIVLCRFCFTNRPLTASEESSFLATGTIPANIGVDQFAVECEHQINNGPLLKVSGSDVVHDSTGVYHIAITATEVGTYTYRGYSLDAGGNPVASTPKMRFAVE